ncbi:hypothetical protein FFF34_007110 [Inquilinus sp. KBS0705]|nr:hypothetical protein FFF34_007110 [Inquilinus sp. KBS0705]
MTISIAIFAVALIMPCFDTRAEDGDTGQGLLCLISGAFGFFSSFTGFIWVANPALLFSWIYIRKDSWLSLSASSIALFIGLLFLKCTEMTVNEGGGTSYITGYRIGYWIWLSSMMIMVIGNVYSYLFIKPIPRQEKFDMEKAIKEYNQREAGQTKV